MSSGDAAPPLDVVGRIIVDDGVNHFSNRDLIEEADELLVAMTLHVVADDGPIEGVEGCEQRGGAVTFVVGRQARARTDLRGGLRGQCLWLSSPRGAGDAIKEVHRLLCRGYTDVVDADLSKYFDTIRMRSCCVVWRAASSTAKCCGSSSCG